MTCRVATWLQSILPPLALDSQYVVTNGLQCGHQAGWTRTSMHPPADTRLVHQYTVWEVLVATPSFSWRAGMLVAGDGTVMDNSLLQRHQGMLVVISSMVQRRDSQTTCV